MPFAPSPGQHRRAFAPHQALLGDRDVSVSPYSSKRPFSLATISAAASVSAMKPRTTFFRHLGPGRFSEYAGRKGALRGGHQCRGAGEAGGRADERARVNRPAGRGLSIHGKLSCQKKAAGRPPHERDGQSAALLGYPGPSLDPVRTVRSRSSRCSASYGPNVPPRVSLWPPGP